MFSKIKLTIVGIAALVTVIVVAVLVMVFDDQASADEQSDSLYCVQMLSPIEAGDKSSDSSNPVCFDNWADAALYESGGEVVLPQDATEREFIEAMDIYYFGEVMTDFGD